MNKKKILIISISLTLMWTCFFVTDMVKCQNDENPVFCLKMSSYDDGGSIYYMGLFYNYFRVRKFNPEIDEDESCITDCYLTDYVITPWFFTLDFAKEQAFE